MDHGAGPEGHSMALAGPSRLWALENCRHLLGVVMLGTAAWALTERCVGAFWGPLWEPALLESPHLQGACLTSQLWAPVLGPLHTGVFLLLFRSQSLEGGARS